MNFFFSILSVAYVAGIFLFADSPMVSTMAPFNPYSLLHIPLYGILTLLLLLSIAPNKRKMASPINPLNYLVAGLIAFGVAIADEIHQAYLPGRHASIMDVFLDTIGIGLCVLVFRRFRYISSLKESRPPKQLS
jgi:VanZ family protein